MTYVLEAKASQFLFWKCPLVGIEKKSGFHQNKTKDTEKVFPSLIFSLLTVKHFGFKVAIFHSIEGIIL